MQFNTGFSSVSTKKPNTSLVFVRPIGRKFATLFNEVGEITTIISDQLGLIRPKILDFIRPKVGDNNNTGGSVSYMPTTTKLLPMMILIKIIITTVMGRSSQLI